MSKTTLIDSLEPGPDNDPRRELRKLASSWFNRTWSLMDKEDRTADDDLAMVHAAHASRHVWGIVGGAREHATGEWQIARVYATLGRGEAAMVHARRSFEIATADELGHFLIAEAHEAIARAAAILGDRDAFDQHLALAQDHAEKIDSDEERGVAQQDIASLSFDG